jgi:hypothetical protein
VCILFFIIHPPAIHSVCALQWCSNGRH